MKGPHCGVSMSTEFGITRFSARSLIWFSSGYTLTAVVMAIYPLWSRHIGFSLLTALYFEIFSPVAIAECLAVFFSEKTIVTLPLSKIILRFVIMDSIKLLIVALVSMAEIVGQIVIRQIRQEEIAQARFDDAVSFFEIMLLYRCMAVVFICCLTHVLYLRQT